MVRVSHPVVKCGFIRRNGKPCQRACAEGFTKCNLHGQRTLASQLEAQRVLDAARLPACETALEIIERFNEDTCAACGYPNHDVDEQRTVLAAIKLVLDRTGMGAAIKLQVAKQSDADFAIDHLLDEERAELVALTARFKALKARIKARINPGNNPPAASQPPRVM